MTSYIYVLGDADNIRKKLQGYLLSGDLESLRRFSSGLTEGVRLVARLAQESMSAEVIFSGGDEVLLRLDASLFSLDELRKIKSRFEEYVGATISFGAGSTTEEAFLNLARAKAMEPGTLVLSSDVGVGAASAGLKQTPDGAD
jgi:CHASE3 domain sensor protein